MGTMLLALAAEEEEEDGGEEEAAAAGAGRRAVGSAPTAASPLTRAMRSAFLPDTGLPSSRRRCLSATTVRAASSSSLPPECSIAGSTSRERYP